MVYVLAYFLLVQATPDLEHDGPIVHHKGIRADYWLGGNASAVLFAPINKIDRRLRRKYWEYPKRQKSQMTASFTVFEPDLRTIRGRVAYTLDMLKSESEEMATRRQRTALAVTKFAANPQLTAEQKTRLHDALKKAMEVEKDQEALAREKEAVAALERGAVPDVVLPEEIKPDE